MDIWSWVFKKQEQLRETGHHRLADIIDELPTYCCDNEHNKMDAVYPEGLSLAKKLKDPWVEVFIRHWYLQSQVLKRNNAKGMLPEAIDLLDLAHQENTKGCPQRICAVQDLANCYATADGPGYVKERLAVSIETLNQIDPSWPCYKCIGAEYVNALLDGNEYQKAYDECTRLKQDIVVTSHSEESGEFGELIISEARSLMRLERYKQAIELLESTPIEECNADRGKSQKLLLCLALARESRFDDIAQHMIPFEQVIESATYYNDWAELQILLINGADMELDDSTLRTFHEMAATLVENGSYRCAFNQLTILFDLSIHNKFFFNASIALSKLEDVVPLLNSDLGATQALVDREQVFAKIGLSEKENFSSMAELSEHEFSNTDEHAQSLISFYEKNRDDVEAAAAVGKIYSDYLHPDMGLAAVKSCYENNKSDSNAVYHYGLFIIREYGELKFFEIFDGLINSITELEIQKKIHWLYAVATRNTSPAKALSYFSKLLQLEPGHFGALYNIAWLHCDLGHYDESIRYWNKVIKLDPKDDDYQWDKLIPATLAKNWKVVENCCEAIGLDLDNSRSPMSQNMGSCRIKFSSEFGSEDIFYAQRTGPVSAVIRGIGNIDEPQRYGQEVVFNPEPLNHLDNEDEKGYACDREGYYNYLYSAYRIISTEVHKCYSIHGIHPGDEEVRTLEQSLNEISTVFSLRSTDDYIIEFEDHENNSRKGPGMYAYILLSPQARETDLHEILSKFSRRQAHPFIWPELLEALSLEKELEEQLALEDHYGL